MTLITSGTRPQHVARSHIDTGNCSAVLTGISHRKSGGAPTSGRFRARPDVGTWWVPGDRVGPHPVGPDMSRASGEASRSGQCRPVGSDPAGSGFRAGWTARRRDVKVTALAKSNSC